MTFKWLMNEYRGMINTPYAEPEHAQKAAYTFLSKNMDQLVQAIELGILAESHNKQLT